jgi:hypothetical protein
VALNDVDIMSCDIANAYLNAPCREKIWYVAGLEFGSRQGQIIKIVRALYGLKSSGASSWRNTLQRTICEELGFETTTADPDVYQSHAVKMDGSEYWELLLVYVDDIGDVVTHQSHTGAIIIDRICRSHGTIVGKIQLRHHRLAVNLWHYDVLVI